MEFERVYVLGLDRGAMRWGAERAGWIADDAARGRSAAGRRRRRRAARAPGLRRDEPREPALVLAYAEQERGVAVDPSRLYDEAREALGAEEITQEEELFGPAEGLHATYRMLRDEVLESSWRAGAALSEMRLDTADDVNRSVARFLELRQARRADPAPRRGVGARGDRRGQRAAGQAGDAGAARRAPALLARRVRARRRPRADPPLRAAGEPRASPGSRRSCRRAAAGLRLSASDVDLYLTCPLKYKFARVFAIPQEPTINQRFGILVHNVLERYHAEELRGSATPGGGGPRSAALAVRGGLAPHRLRLLRRRAAVPRPRRRRARPLLRARQPGGSRPVWLERRFSFKIGDNTISGRIDRVDRHPDGNYELIDYKTGAPKSEAELTGDLQIALYRIAARESWDIEVADGSYWYVLDDEKVRVAGEPGRARARRAHGRGGLRGDHRPGLRAAAELRELLLVRLPVDLPGRGSLSAQVGSRMSTEFLLTTLIVVATPGTGVVYTIAAGISRGRAASVWAAVGCTLGILPHMLAAITGLAALLHASAVAFSVVKYLGVLYLLVMAWMMLRERGALVIPKERETTELPASEDRRLRGADEPAEPEADDLLPRVPAAVRQLGRLLAPAEHARAQRRLHGDDVRRLRDLRPVRGGGARQGPGAAARDALAAPHVRGRVRACWARAWRRRQR